VIRERFWLHPLVRNNFVLASVDVGMRIHVRLSILLLLAFVSNPCSFASDLALVHAKVYSSPTSPPIEDATILVHNGRIRAVGPSANIKLPRFARAVTVLDCRGLVVIAGFWNSHVHILTPGLLHAEKQSSGEISSQLDQMLNRWGFTTVFDLASVLDNTNNIRRRIATGQIRGPRIFTVGEPFYPKGGTPIYVKGFLEDNHNPPAEVRNPRHRPWNEYASRSGMAPTGSRFFRDPLPLKAYRQSAEENAMWIKQAVQELKTYSDAGGQILFGTDVGYIDQFDS
jgi:hypothetical protein